MLESSTKLYAEKPLFGVEEEGKYQWVTYKDFSHEVDQMRANLESENIKKGLCSILLYLFNLTFFKGDRVALVCNNRREWAVIAYATYGRGAILVPMYENQAESDVRFILKNSEASLLFVGTKSLAQTYSSIVGSPDSKVKKVISIDPVEETGQLENYCSAIERGSSSNSPVETVEPEEVSTLIYTSGTTGKPKGVMLSHANICSNVKAVSTVLENKINSNSRSLAFLTWAHVFGQTMELHQIISKGGSMGLTSPKHVMKDIRIVKPTILVAVPAVFERVYESVLQNVQKGRYGLRPLA